MSDHLFRLGRGGNIRVWTSKVDPDFCRVETPAPLITLTVDEVEQLHRATEAFLDEWHANHEGLDQ